MTHTEDNGGDSRVDRFYIRCADCLSIGVVEQAYQPGWHCSVCSGAVELMGKVIEDTRKYETSEERSACDKRCTHAVGPICVCKCNCKNHGTGRVVQLQVIKDLPVVVFADDAEALSAAESFRRAIAFATDQVEAWLNIRRDHTAPYELRQKLYRSTWAAQVAMKGAIEARTWKARNKHTAALHQTIVEAL